MDFTPLNKLEIDELEAVPTNDNDEIEAELEELMQPEDSNELDELEALLGDAMKERATAQSVADARKKAKGGFALSADDQARIRAWELAREWIAVANVALFRRYECACGKHSTVYEGLMLEQKHRSNQTANRWTTQENALASLPNKTAIRTSAVPVCPVCAEPKGWSLRTNLHWKI